jgi:hypothetical protein
MSAAGRDVLPEISRFAATLRIAASVDLEELLRGLAEAGLTMRRDRGTGDFVILPRGAMRQTGDEAMEAAVSNATDNLAPVSPKLSLQEQRRAIGRRMAEPRLKLAEDRITRQEYWDAVDALAGTEGKQP